MSSHLINENITSYNEFIIDNRKRINRYLNIILWLFIVTGPAIALGVWAGFFPRVEYETCINISIIMLFLSLVHIILLRKFPDTYFTSMFALVSLNLLLVYMCLNHVEIHLTWFLVPLLSLMFCDLKSFFYATVLNYVLMGTAVYLNSEYGASLRAGMEPAQYFGEVFGGFTIESSIMVISGLALEKISERYFRELIDKYKEIRTHEDEMQERMDILDSMAEIYDNVNLLDFIENTEMSLRDEHLVAKKLDPSRQTHTLMNQRISSYVMPDQMEDFLKFTNITTVRTRLTNKKIITGEFIDIINGWFRAQYITVNAGEDGIPSIVIYTTRNIDEEKRREEHLIRISMTDELTRLYNRRCYDEDVAEIRKTSLPDNFVLLSIDVNGLKTANDTLGHAAGDELIKGAADCLASTIGSRGKAYRTGGDEFLAVVKTDDPEGLCEKIREKTREWHGMYLSEMSMSVGFAACRDYEGATIDELEKAADTSMYAEKERYYKEKGIERRKT